MRRSFALIVMIVLTALPAFSQSAPAAPAKPSPEEVLAALRADIQATKADILAKNITLSAEQAAKFWPMYETYQKEQGVIIDAQLGAIQQFVSQYNTLDDATALSIINANFDRDIKVANLRMKWLKEFQKVIPVKIAVRAMQIDRQLSLASQFEIAAAVPLVR
jgi:hypothetical protein